MLRLLSGSGIGRYLRQGDAARDDKQWDEACRAYEAALAAKPELAHIWVQLGHARKELGRMQAAEVAYRRALAKAPDVADTHLQLGHLLKITGRTEDAAQSYAMARKLDPATTDAATELARLGYSAEGKRNFDLHVGTHSLTQHSDGRIDVDAQAIPSGDNSDEALRRMGQEHLQVIYEFHIGSSAAAIVASGYAGLGSFDQARLSLKVSLPPGLLSSGQPGLLHFGLKQGRSSEPGTRDKSLAWIAVSTEETDLVLLYKSLTRGTEIQTMRLSNER